MSMIPKSDWTLLIHECRRVVDEEGYDYKKGKSRSWSLIPDVSSEPPKRKKINEVYCLSRIAELQERIKDITDQLVYKEIRRESAGMIHNYKKCDQITELDVWAKMWKKEARYWACRLNQEGKKV